MAIRHLKYLQDRANGSYGGRAGRALPDLFAKKGCVMLQKRKLDVCSIHMKYSKLIFVDFYNIYDTHTHTL